MTIIAKVAAFAAGAIVLSAAMAATSASAAPATALSSGFTSASPTGAQLVPAQYSVTESRRGARCTSDYGRRGRRTTCVVRHPDGTTSVTRSYARSPYSRGRRYYRDGY